MPRIEFSFFRELVQNKIQGKNCEVKKAIGRQLELIGKPQELLPSKGRGGYAIFTDAAAFVAGLHWEGEANALIDNYRKRGSGNAPMAIALWYWLYLHSNRRSYAHAVTKVAFGEAKILDVHFDLDPANELSVLLRRSTSNEDEVGPLVDINMLGQFLDTFLIRKQTDPCLMIALSDMERILEPMSALRDGKPASLRSVLNQSPWINIGEIDTSNPDATTWVFRDQPLLAPHNGANYARIREDGARISTNALHQINSWLIVLWQLNDSETIPEDKLDILLRYLLVLCSDNRSTYLEIYFPDDAGKMDKVFSAAARRAYAVGLDPRDYRTLDQPYRDILFATA